MTCPFGHPECGGYVDLYFGLLPCFRCFNLLPPDDHAAIDATVQGAVA